MQRQIQAPNIDIVSDPEVSPIGATPDLNRAVEERTPMRRLIAMIPPLLYVLPALAVRDAEVRNPVDSVPISLSNLLLGALALWISWLIADIAHRTAFGRAPTSEQRVVWVIGLIFGGALVIGLLRN